MINCPGAGVQISSWKAPCKRSPLEPQAVTAAVSRDPSRPGVSLARKVCAPPRGYLGATELRVVSVARLDLELVEYTIPIVIPAAIDPVGAGLAESIARPGGDVTGFALLTLEISSKRRGCLRRPCCAAPGRGVVERGQPFVHAGLSVGRRGPRLVGPGAGVGSGARAGRFPAAFQGIASQRPEGVFVLIGCARVSAWARSSNSRHARSLPRHRQRGI